MTNFIFYLILKNIVLIHFYIYESNIKLFMTFYFLTFGFYLKYLTFFIQIIITLVLKLFLYSFILIIEEQYFNLFVHVQLFIIYFLTIFYSFFHNLPLIFSTQILYSYDIDLNNDFVLFTDHLKLHDIFNNYSKTHLIFLNIRVYL